MLYLEAVLANEVCDLAEMRVYKGRGAEHLRLFIVSSLSLSLSFSLSLSLCVYIHAVKLLSGPSLGF